MNTEALGEPNDTNRFSILDVVKLGGGFAVEMELRGDNSLFRLNTNLVTLDLYVIDEPDPYDEDDDAIHEEHYIVVDKDVRDSFTKAVLARRIQRNGYEYHMFEFNDDRTAVVEMVWPLRTEYQVR